MIIGVVQPAGGQFDQNLVLLGPVEVDVFNLSLLMQPPRHRGFGFHRSGVQVAGRLLMPLMKLASAYCGSGAEMSGMRV